MKRYWIGSVLWLSMLISGCGPAPLTAEVLDPDRALTAAPPVSASQTPRPTATPRQASPTPSPAVSPDDPTRPPLSPSKISPTPEDIAVTPRPTAAPPPDEAGNQLVEKAKADLANRLNVDAGQIALLEFRNLVWSDGSLGCPRPGMAYIQIAIEGYFIQLGLGDRVFEYHGGQGRDPFLCQDPDKPAPPPGFVDR